MKRAIYLSILGVITAICVVIGIVRCIGHYAYGKWGGNYGEVVTLDPQSLEAFEKMDFDMDLLSVNIEEGDDYTISYTASEKLVPEYRVENGTLYVEQKGDWKTDFRGGSSRMSVTITVPRDALLENIDMNADVGDIKIKDIQTQQFTCEADVGNVDVKRAKLGTTDISADVGNVDIRETELADTQIEASVGNVDMKGVTLQNTDISADLGNVKVDVNGNKKEYALDLEAEMGNIKVDGNRYHSRVQTEGKNQLRVNGSMGNVSVDFN